MLAVTCSIIFFSCTDDVKVTDPLSDFSSITPTYLSVTNCIDLESYEIYKPGNIVKYDDKYIVQDKYDDYLVKAIELNASTIYNGFHRGNGPDEFTSIGSLQVFDSEPFVYDIADPRDSFEEKVVRKDLLQKIVDIVLIAQKENPSKEFLKIFYLRYIKEFKQKEIAEEVNISQAEVSKRLIEILRIVKSHF